MVGTAAPQFVEIKKDIQEEWSRQNGGAETSQSTSLTKKQKYAIVGLMAYVQGASPLSIYDDDANKIMQALFVSLGLSKQEIETFLKQSMQRNGEEEANSIIDTLHTIGDKEYLRALYRKALTVARISESKETIESVRHIFGELNI